MALAIKTFILFGAQGVLMALTFQTFIFFARRYLRLSYGCDLSDFNHIRRAAPKAYLWL